MACAASNIFPNPCSTSCRFPCASSLHHCHRVCNHHQAESPSPGPNHQPTQHFLDRRTSELINSLIVRHFCMLRWGDVGGQLQGAMACHGTCEGIHHLPSLIALQETSPDVIAPSTCSFQEFLVLRFSLQGPTGGPQDLPLSCRCHVSHGCGPGKRSW